MNKEELTAIVAELLGQIGTEPMAKGSNHRPAAPQPEARDYGHSDGDFVEDVSELDLRKLYLTEAPADPEAFRKLKSKTPARLGSGRAGPRYKTLTMLRFRADHAAAQDAVFSQVPDDFGEKHGLVSVQTRCQDKDMYLTRPDLGRVLDAENMEKLRSQIPTHQRVLLVVGDGLSSQAVQANAPDCMAAIRDGLTARGIDTGKGVFVRYCRVGASDAIGDITGCEVLCMLVGERPGLVTAQSMSAYLTYRPRTGIPESSRTVVSNIHAQGTPAVEAGAYVAELIETILKRQMSGVGLHTEAGV